MKNKILGVISLVVAIFLVVFYMKYQNVENYKNKIRQFPEINLLDYSLNKSSFYDKGEINCFLMFNSECGFCLDEIEDIVDNKEDFNNVNFYLVSNQPKEILMEYSEDSEFYGLDNFVIICDEKEIFHDFFNHETIPSTYIYNKQGKLINYKKGFVPIQLLKEIMYND